MFANLDIITVIVAGFGFANVFGAPAGFPPIVHYGT
jgi:hypothetical protein